MNKTELIKQIATVSGLSQAQASNALDALRTGRNPKTGETITIAAAQAVKFKAGKSLKDAVA